MLTLMKLFSQKTGTLLTAISKVFQSTSLQSIHIHKSQ